MEKTSVLWTARPSVKTYDTWALLFVITITLAFPIFLFILQIGVDTAPDDFVRALWLIVRVASILLYLVEMRDYFIRPIWELFTTRYVLTTKSLIIQKGRKVKVRVPVEAISSYNIIKRNKGSVDIQLTISAEVTIVLRGVKQERDLRRSLTTTQAF